MAKAKAEKAVDKTEPTATELKKLRDTQQLSWALVGKAFGASASTARRQYSDKVRPHTESVLEGKGTGRPAGGGNGNGNCNGWTPVDLTELTTVAAVRKAIEGAVVRVQPIRANGKSRQFLAAKVAKLAKGDTPTIDITDAAGKPHTVRLDKVDATRAQA